MRIRSHRWRVLWATLISVVPLAAVRRVLLGLIHGYTIHPSARVEMFAVIAVDSATIAARARVGRFTKFTGPFSLRIDEGVRIGPSNVIACGSFAGEAARVNQGFTRTCHLKRDALMTSNHYVDVSGGFTLGEHSWIGGRGSQFWTHGANLGGQAVSIGDRTYVGSAVRFAPGATVGNESLVSLGAVVTKAFTEPRLLLGGVPAKVLRENIEPVWSEDGKALRTAAAE